MFDTNHVFHSFPTYKIGEWDVDFIVGFYYKPQDGKTFDELMTVIDIEIYSMTKDGMYLDMNDVITGFASQIIEPLLMDKYVGDMKFNEAVRVACYQAYIERQHQTVGCKATLKKRLKGITCAK